MAFLEPGKYGTYFHDLFVNNFDARKISAEKSPKRRNKQLKDKRKDGGALLFEPNFFTSTFSSLQIELEPNASKFAVFSAVRSSVLEAETKWAISLNSTKKINSNTACCTHCASSCRNDTNFECRCHSSQGAKVLHGNDNDSDGESESENTTEKEVMQKVPQIVGAGLKSLFELIAEARNVHPNLCTKALKALMDVIQGQSPESFKSEPNELINPLYDLLLDLATLFGPGNGDKNDANSWSAIGCSSLLGLAVARGDTGKILKAVAALLMSPKILSAQNIQLPQVLSTLQRSVQASALGKSTKPDYFKNGVPANSLIDQFSVKNQIPPNIQYTNQPSITCDGKFIYILVSKALLKIGSGYNGTLKGNVYASNYEFGKDKNGWIGFCNGILYYRRISKRMNDALLIVNTETLVINGTSPIIISPQTSSSTTRGCGDGQLYCSLFTDGESLNMISTTKDDSLVVKQLYNSKSTMNAFDLPLKLARKNFRTLGYASFEDEVLNQNQIQKIQSSYNPFEPKLPNEMEVVNIVCGKEFGLVRTASGKVFYYGKAASLGLKAIGKSPTLKMTELIISKVASITQIALGHDGVHALLVNDDGTVYFTGSARRGEDGDSSKNRRQPKAVKPKKISKIDGHFIVHASCNNGTSAFVTKTGKLIMFGKDTTHCDASGFVTELMEQQVTKVALGKAHCVVLNSKGHLFSFGLNNKGQCGRVFVKDKETASSAMETSVDTHKVGGAGHGGGGQESGNKMQFDMSNMCDPDDHNFVHGKCRVCSVCKECTGYNITCVSALSLPIPDRVSGANCACGHGDAGCSKCGACFTCIKYQESLADDGCKDVNYSLIGRQRSRSLIMKKKEKKPGALEDVGLHVPADVERDTPRVAPLPPQKVVLATTSPVVQVSCGLHHTVVLTFAGEIFTFGSNQYGQLGSGDLQAIQGPYQVKVPGFVSQVSAGSNHTVVMTSKGIVYTFGNYQKGQLGRLPNDMQAANVNEQDICTQMGGNKIGGDDSSSTTQGILNQRKRFLWNCTPGAVSGIGPNYGKRASWIGASCDQTFIKIDESLITGAMLSKVNIVADESTILLIPVIPLTFSCLAISRRDGTCNAHISNQVDFVRMIQQNNTLIKKTASDDKCNQNIEYQHEPLLPLLQPLQQPSIERMSQSIHEARNHNIFDIDENNSHHRKHIGGGAKAQQEKNVEKILPQLAFCIDACYGVLWVFDSVAKHLMVYNVIASEMNVQTKPENFNNFKAILTPELALPLKSQMQITRAQASLNLLACLDILTSVQEVLSHCFDPPTQLSQNSLKETATSEYQIACRFENFGGGWGYSGHSVEAIRFMSDTDILIGGFGMFGGRGEYTCKMKLFDLGNDGGGFEKDGILVSETDDIPFECPARSKHNIMLPKALTANAGKWYLVWARISGPSSDCGSSGQSTVTTEDQVVFTFKSSKKANNGTDVNSGQIPSILYRVITHETKQPSISHENDPVHKITKFFANTVTKECFESLVVLLNWSWGTFKVTLIEFKEKKKNNQTKLLLHNLVYISKASLRLLKKYINEIYPNNIFYKSEKSPQKQSKPTADQDEGLAGGAAAAAAASSVVAAPNKNIAGFSYENKMNVIFDQIQSSSSSKGGAGFLSDLISAVNNGTSSSGMEATTPTNTKKINSENLQLAECIGDVRALLMQVLCDEVQQDLEQEGCAMLNEILEECHNTYVSCFNAFYPTSTLKWNCLCDLLTQMDKGTLYSRLLSAILAGLCSPTVKLRSTFSLLTPVRECKSLISPSDNSGLPMLTSTENHMYPVLVEQMIYRTQQEKCDFMFSSWTFKDVLVRLLDIISYPIRSKIEGSYSRRESKELDFYKAINQGLIDNCCHLLSRVLAEIVYQSCTSDFDISLLPSRSLHSTGSRFSRCDVTRTWNTGNFGPDAIAFSVDRPGIAIAGAVIYSGTGSYEYQLELLFETIEAKSQSQHRWETLESISGTYDQDAVRNDTTEIKFERPIHLKEYSRYAIRLCSQGARTCSGDAGLSSLRGPCGTTFTFYPCDLSFNGTTPARGQIPSILYYSTPLKNENNTGKFLNELHARDTALHIASDITKRCTELLVLARNAIAVSSSPSDKSPNSSNNTQTIDLEHNITPIEEHLDISWANNSNNTSNDSNVSAARDLTKKFESFSKGIMETLKFDKRSTNPFEFEIEIGATDINPHDLLEENDILDRNIKNGEMSKINGNNRIDANELDNSESEDSLTQISRGRILEMFGVKDSSLFHTLLPLVFSHIGPLVNSDPKSSVQLLTLIREILPHVAALNQTYSLHRDSDPNESMLLHKIDNLKSETNLNLCTTSNHYCVIESEHPYKSSTIASYRIEFPACVHWFTVEFDSQCGTPQPEDCLLISIPKLTKSEEGTLKSGGKSANEVEEHVLGVKTGASSSCKHVDVVATSWTNKEQQPNSVAPESDWIIIKKFNTSSHWQTNAIVIPGNRIEFSFQTASDYLNDQQANRYGFKCLIVGYDNPSLIKYPNFSLMRLENELAYLGGMCSANLMKKDLVLPDDKSENLTCIEDTMLAHSSLLSKGLALPDTLLTISQVLDSQFPKGGQSNERQFLKDFVTGAPGSSGARLAAWLQPEPRLDPNRCELKPIQEAVRYGWPTQLIVVTRDQYGDNVFVPDLKIEIKAVPAGAVVNGSRKTRHVSQIEPCSLGGMALPPKVSYESTVKEKMCFKAITFMKVYQQYSFEELRYASPIQTRVTETMIASDLRDGTFGTTWTPNVVGNYCLTVIIDGISLEEVTRVEVKEAGIPPPPQKGIVKTQPPNKLRKFIAKYSAGLRIRSHPTLQSEQVGIIKLNGIISFIDEIENDDGIWVRLSTQSIRQHCTPGWYPTEAWCLQYNQHIGKTLLHPLIETAAAATKASILERIRRNSNTENEANDFEAVPEPQPQPKVNVSSPGGKKGFDFTHGNKFTPPLSSDSGKSGSNPFIFTSTQTTTKPPKPDEILRVESLDDQESDSTDIKMRDNPMSTSGGSFNLSQSPSQSNIGTTIAGVVGGGASKLQALHKWFKGDSLDSPRDPNKKKSDLSEFAAVSVRDIVKAIGGQDSSKSNGNGGAVGQSRSSSPALIPQRQRELHSNHSNSSRSPEISDSALSSSLTRDLSQSPSHSSIREELKDNTASESDESFTQTAAMRHSIVGTPTRQSVNLSPSKMGLRKARNRRTVSPGLRNIANQGGVEKLLKEALNQQESEFNINVNTESMTTSGSEHHKSSSSAGSDKLNTPLAWPVIQNQIPPPPSANCVPPKRALPPSLAESLRAIFAAFLWHEGIVHDAMACASFLKFHPSLPKQGAIVVTRGDMSDTKMNLTREERAQQRHSVEVANTGNYLNIRPSTLETLTKSGNSSIHNRRYRKMNSEAAEPSDKSKLPLIGGGPEIITVLPPALRSLVYLWEKLCSNCVQLVQSNAMEQFKESNNPPAPSLITAGINAATNTAIINQAQMQPATPLHSRIATQDNLDNGGGEDKDARNARKKKKEDASWCELCETFLPIPVTHHMRVIHPGCGKPSKGKGYNSVGDFCPGWAGNCGEGGKGASSWYLMCEKCREKYRTGSKNINNLNTNSDNLTSPTSVTPNTIKVDNLFGLKTSLIINSEIYTMMKDNALFLLELSSTSSANLGNAQKRSPQQMPVVSETHVIDTNRPGTSRSSREIRYSTGGGKPFVGKNLFPNGNVPSSSTPHRKSSNFLGSVSPDLIWPTPEVFACLESLGASVANELPYEIFGFNENGYERPLSEMSFESAADPSVIELGSGIVPQQNQTPSKFHRSLSMGQGWSSHQSGKYYGQQINELGLPDQTNRVVLRRRNNSSNENKESGSLLLCYPSANLRKLVPDNILASSCIVQQNTEDVAVQISAATTTNKNDDNDDDTTTNLNSQIGGAGGDEKLNKNLRANSTENYSTELPAAAVDKSKIDDSSENDVKMEAPNLMALQAETNLNASYLLSRPSMAFILQQHDLEKLKTAMKRSLRIATCRIYSLQAINWLMRSVTQPNCLHDLMWWFVAALTYSSKMTDENFKSDDAEQALEHPITSTQMSGKVSQVLSQSLHSFLQTIADLTLLLPAGSALQRIAIQCFGIKFRQADHQFLHRSHVFSNISKILSKSDEQNEDMLINSMHESNTNVLFGGGGHHTQSSAKITSLVDLVGMFEITVSSRQALTNSLTDNSTETFWESDEEDRNKSKIIEISLSKSNYACKVIFVHVDNSRDIANKVSNITFYAGQSLGDTNLIKTIDIDAKCGVWIQANIKDETATHFRLELRGPDNTLRVRQLKLLGHPTSIDELFMNQKHSNPKQTSSYQIQQRNCEAETLRVFRLITGQVFGKLIIGPDQSNIDLNTIQPSAAMESSTTSLLADSLDMREHMVGILFSRSKLSHLQKQVIVHIVHAIRKEAQRAKEEWEILNSSVLNIGHGHNIDQKSDSSSEHSRAPDTYCFEMLSMVLALSGSAVGRAYLSHQHGLLKDLLSLLHTGSDRVQRQVTALLRRMLPEITPEILGDLMGVNYMPPNDFNIVHQNFGDFDICRLGIIDIFLAVIAKSLQLQIKIKTSSSYPVKNPPTVKLINCIDFTIQNLKNPMKTSIRTAGELMDTESPQSFVVRVGTNNPFEDNDFEMLETEDVNDGGGATTMKPRDFELRRKFKETSRNLNQRWFLKGTISTKQAENMIGLIRDMTSGKLTDKWSLMTKAAIAESILNLTRLDEIFRTPENCTKTPTLWLALASLCVLDRDHVEKLSSGQWSKPSESRPLCSNHDDGITPAIIQCDACGSLCIDCDRFLHLNRKTRNHHRTVCKEEEEAIRVELHESCGRTKLFWLLALADSKTLKAMVEFRDGNNTIISGPPNLVGRCRFCGITGNSGLLAVGNICAAEQCQEYAASSCGKIRPCGHVCGGVVGEQKCLPCLQHTCHDRENDVAENLKEPRLTQDADDMCMICFTEALSCAPSIQLECGHVFHCHCCKAVLTKRWTGPRISFGFSQCPICKTDIAHPALVEILEPINNLKEDVKRKALMRIEYEGVDKKIGHKDLTSYAMDRYAYYVCFKCQKAYYGGEARCDAEVGDNYDPEELVCGGCSDVARAQMCPKHGTDFLEYKCRFCCSVAVFFCFGTTHFCDTCHDDFQRLTNIPKNKLPRCPAGPNATQILGEDCPLHIVHPPTGEEFALGCGICRNPQTF